MRSYYDLLYDVGVAARDPEEVARAAIRHGQAIFRAEIVAVTLRDGDDWVVLPFRPGESLAEPLRLARVEDPEAPPYEPGQVIDIPDLPAFARRFPALQAVVERGVLSMVYAAFGTRVDRGFISFLSSREQHYSRDEYTLMSLHALAAGIGFDRVGYGR